MTAVNPGHLDALDALVSDVLRRVRTFAPANVVAFTPATPGTIATATVQIARKLSDLEGRTEPIKPIARVPIVWPGSSEIMIWWDLVPGDDVLLGIPHRSIGAWLRKGGLYDPKDTGIMDYAQCVAWPVRMTRSRGAVPTLGGLCIGTPDGRALIRIAKDGTTIDGDALTSIRWGAEGSSLPLAKAGALGVALAAAMDAGVVADPTFGPAANAIKTSLAAALASFSTTKVTAE